MTFGRITAAVCTATFLGLGNAGAAVEIQPGLWEEVETGEENGKQVKPEKTTECVSPADAKLPEKSFITEEMKAQCPGLKLDQTSSGFVFKMKCGPKEASFDIEGSVTILTPQHYTTATKSTIVMAGQRLTSNKTSVAKRIGDCKK